MSWPVAADAATLARLRLARLQEGAPVRLAGRPGLYAYLGQDDGRIRLRAPEGGELLAGPLAVEPVEIEGTPC